MTRAALLCAPSPVGWRATDPNESEITVRRQWLRSLAAAAAASIFALSISSAPAHADPGVLVYPGMEIHQGSSVCTLGFVDLGARTAFTAGH